VKTRTEITDIADQAYAENASGAVAGDEVAQAYLDGVEQALRWVTGDGIANEFEALLERGAVARYEAALARGLSDYEAREEGWPSG
jgi:hypothetical protein